MYKIEYVTNPAEVDIFKRESLWGQIDFWTRTIRIYDHNRPEEDIWQTLVHEVLHGISTMLHLSFFDADDKKKHDELDVLALALTDIMFRNGWIGGKKEEAINQETKVNDSMDPGETVT